MKFEIVGKIDMESNVVFNFNGLDFSHILEHKGECDCCQTKHFRKTTYVVKEDNGKLYQVGTSCLEKFMCRKLTPQENAIVLGMDDKILFPLSANGSKDYNLKDFIYNLLIINKKWGYDVKIHTFMESGYENNEKLLQYLLDNDILLVNNRDYTEVEQIVEFYKNKDFYNDFKSNVKGIVESGFVNARYINIAKYIVKVYNDEMEYQNKCKMAPKSIAIDYTETTLVNLKAKGYNQFQYSYNGWADTFTYLGQDVNGNFIEWSTSKQLSEEDLEKYQNATIKYRLKNQGYESQMKGYVNKVRNVVFK